MQSIIKTVGTAHCLGDALGAPYEGKRNKKRKFERLEFIHRAKISSVHVGTRLAALAQWTDDTENALVILSTLIENDFVYDRNKTVLGYMKWANSKPFGMGNNEKRYFYGVKTLSGYEKRVSKQKPDDVECESDGTIMRAWPLAFAKNWEFASVEDAKITNNNKINIGCNVIYVELIRGFVNGLPKIEIFKNLYKTANKFDSVLLDCVEDAISDALDGGKITKEFNNEIEGWVVYGLYFAVYSAFVSDKKPLEIISEVISQRIDTDTMAAISGAVLGARFPDMFKDEKVKELASQVLKCDTTQGKFPRPECFCPGTYFN